MAIIAPQKIVPAGTKPTFAAATTNNQLEVGTGRRFLVVKNTDGTNTRTVTVVIPGADAYGTVTPDPAYTVAITSGEVWVPILPAANDGTGYATVNITGTGFPTGCTMAYVEPV